MKPKIAFAVLGITSSLVATGLASSVSATATLHSSQPVVFISQPENSSVQAEELAQWEKQLYQSLGLSDYVAQSACSSTVSHCPDADDSDVDYC